jgi:hypothetical protein
MGCRAVICYNTTESRGLRVGRKKPDPMVSFIWSLRIHKIGWWLRPVIPATQEAQLRRMAVQSQPRQKKKKRDPHLKINTQCEKGLAK